jgi:UDP-glucose 4-epimerase
MRIVITGASGFLGSHIRANLENIFEVIPISLKEKNGFVFVSSYHNTPTGDLLIHLAEESSRIIFNMSSDVNIKKNYDLISRLTDRFEGRVIYASSGVVYGDNGIVPFDINSDCNSDLDPYAKSKIICESKVLQNGGVVVRLANLYGPGMSQKNIMSDILRQLPLSGDVLVNDDKPIRDFLAVTDAAEAFNKILITNPKGIVNVGTGVGTSIHNLAKILLDLSGQPNRRIIAKYPSKNPSVNILDINLTESMIGWRPTKLLGDHLKDFFINPMIGK